MMLGVNTALVGTALMIPRIWDAFTDPVMGLISDNYHSKWGRRKPFIVIGAALMGIVFGLIWLVPEALEPDCQNNLFCCACSFSFLHSLRFFTFPIPALTYEMTPDYNERTRVMAYNAFFHKLGEFIYQWMIPLATVVLLAVFFACIVCPKARMSIYSGVRM